MNALLIPKTPGVVTEKVRFQGTPIEVQIRTSKFTVEINAHDFTVKDVTISSANAVAIDAQEAMALFCRTVEKALATKKKASTDLSWAIVTVD